MKPKRIYPNLLVLVCSLDTETKKALSNLEKTKTQQITLVLPESEKETPPISEPFSHSYLKQIFSDIYLPPIQRSEPFYERFIKKDKRKIYRKLR